MYSTSDNKKFTPYIDANDVIDELFKSLHSSNQGNLETSMSRSDFIFDLAYLMNYKCYEVNYIRGDSYIDFPGMIKKKKSTINPKNADDKCFQNAATVALNYKEIESHPERASNIKPFISNITGKE